MYVAMGSDLGAFAGAAEQCQGGEVSESGTGSQGDHCCEPQTWGSLTYGRVKGSQSLHRWLEKRIQAGLMQLLGPGEITPDNLSQYAYNVGAVAPDPALRNAVMVALGNFMFLFPESRWKAISHAREGKYQDWKGDPMCGPYDVWRSGPVAVTDAHAALLSRLTGASITRAQLRAVGNEWDTPLLQNAAWQTAPKPLLDWATHMRELVGSVPTAHAEDQGSHKRVPAKEKLLATQDGIVVAGPWLSAFIQALSPKGGLMQKAGPRFTVKPDRPLVMHPATGPSLELAADPTEDQAGAGGLSPRALAVGATALVAIGFGIFVAARGRRRR